MKKLATGFSAALGLVLLAVPGSFGFNSIQAEDADLQQSTQPALVEAVQQSNAGQNQAGSQNDEEIPAQVAESEKAIENSPEASTPEAAAVEEQTTVTALASADAAAAKPKAEKRATKKKDVVSGEPAVEKMTPDTLEIGGVIVPYCEYRMAATAPPSGAGVWMGSDSTTDGSWCYFIGHNPGDFTCVANLRNGDAVTVCDSNGQTHTYTVFSVFNIPNTTYWEQLQPKVTGYGESVILQTCLPGNEYRIVLAN